MSLGPRSDRVSYHRFLVILSQTPLQVLFQSCTEFTCYFIELCNPLLRTYLFDQGKMAQDSVKMMRFLVHYKNVKVVRVRIIHEN